MPLYWISQAAARTGPSISQGAAAAAAAAGWVLAAAAAWWFGDDEPDVPWPNSGSGWCDASGDYPKSPEELMAMYE